MKLIVNLPALNEESKIGETIKRIPREIKGFDEVLIQVIDDGSKDKTVEVSKEAGADRVYSHPTNRGIGVTFRTAILRALRNDADIMINMDADGQFNPQDIEKLTSPILDGQADIVSADRFGAHKAKNIPMIKSILNQFAAKVIGKFLKYEINDLTCGFRAYSRDSMLRLNLPGNFTYTQESIIDAIGKNLKVKWVPVEVTYFAERKSRVVKSVYSYINNSFRIIIRAIRDVRPMRFFGIPGFFLLLIAFVSAAVFLFLYSQDLKVTPYRNYLFLSITSLLVGIQFIIFALIADMIRANRKLIEDLTYTERLQRFKKIK
jgi:glycosyltransferase involved in cell wall biosynthesis